MKFHKVILALTALIILFNEAESQFQPTPTDPFFPPITPTPTPTSPRPPPPPPPPPTTPKTTSSSPPPIKSPSTTSSAPLTTSALPSVPSSPLVPPPQSSLPPVSSSPTPSSKSPEPSPSTSAPSPQFDCSVLRSCSDPKTYCDIPAGKCRSKKNLGDQCNNDDHECLDPFVCRENTCGYSDVATANARSKGGSDNYNVKRVAIFGAIIVGAAGICGLVFFVIRYLKKKKDYDIASRLYSTDDDMSETDPYPFAERSNSFSQNTVQPPRAPTTNRYDNLPPTGNRGFAPRPGYQNYYNKYGNEGMYMRQNMQNIPNEERTMNLLQQTRGNVMVTPQQNYKWNPAAMRMNQGGLFPIPSVNVVPNNVPPPNNANNVVPPSNNTNNTRNFNNPGEDDESKHDHLVKTLRYSVDYTNDNHHHQMNNPKVVRKDSNTLSSDDGKLKSDGKKETKSKPNMSSKASKEKFEKTHSTYDPSVLDTYARDSTFAKALGTKLSQSSMKYSDEPKASTIQQSISRTQIVNDI